MSGDGYGDTPDPAQCVRDLIEGRRSNKLSLRDFDNAISSFTLEELQILTSLLVQVSGSLNRKPAEPTLYRGAWKVFDCLIYLMAACGIRYPHQRNKTITSPMPQP